MSRSLVVVGAGVGGLSAAIHARLLNWDVLVLEKGLTPGGKAAGIQEGGYWLDPGPSIIILIQVYQELFRRANRRIEDYIEFQKLEFISRVSLEDEEPIDLPADVLKCLSLLRGLSPKDADSLESLIDKLDKVEPLLWSSVYSHSISSPLQLLNPSLIKFGAALGANRPCLLYTSPSPRDGLLSRMPSSA